MPATLALDLLLAADIPDPTDFPEARTAPGLRALDAALRCNICSDLIDCPVSLNCGHSFCSMVGHRSYTVWKGCGVERAQCVRSYIADKAECPSCRKAATEHQLRLNTMMEYAVAAWKEAR
jgi:E3 ubiquitin-protein ligase RAD18